MEFSRLIIPAVAYPYEDHGRAKLFKIRVSFHDDRLSMVVTTPGWLGQSYHVLRWYSTRPNDGVTREQVKMIADIWERYHLNDMNPGTPKQMEFVRDFRAKHNNPSYERICRALEKAGLLYDNGYRYGSGWLLEPVPDEVLKLLFSFEPGFGSTWQDIEAERRIATCNVNMDELFSLISSCGSS